MRLNINNLKYENISIEIRKLNKITGANNSGKTSFCNYLKDGFEGKLKKNFLINGNEITKSEYFVYIINETDGIEIENSLTSKSIIKQQIDFQIDILEEQINEEINLELKKIETRIENNILKKINILKDLEMNLNLNLKEIIFKNIQLEINEITLKEMGFTQRRKKYIELFLSIISNIKEKTILIIDEFDLGMSEYQSQELLNILEEFSAITEIMIFITSSKFASVHEIYITENTLKNELINKEKYLKYYFENLGENHEESIKYYSEEEIKNILNNIKEIKKIKEHFLSNKKTKIDTNLKKALNY